MQEVKEKKDIIGGLKKGAASKLADIPDQLERLKEISNPISSMKSGQKECQTISKEWASLCVLSYKRPDYLEKSLKSLRAKPAYPYELIIHDDGSPEDETHDVLDWARISGATVISNPPNYNQGQGVALNRMFNISTGDPIIKLDADLQYRKGWLTEVVRLMNDNPKIGLLGLLHYYHEPVDSKKTVIKRHDEWSSHTHILGSAFAVRRECWEEIGPFEEHYESFGEDWDFQQRVTASDNWVCALPKEDLVENTGMGIGRSTIVLDNDNNLQTIKKEPYIVK